MDETFDPDVGHAVAFRDVRDDEWWCKGHIPGNPLLPGVLMLEAAAQLAAFMERYWRDDFRGFVGYGGVDDCKFRLTVKPPARLWFLCQRVEARSRRIICYVQGILDGKLAFESKVTGLVGLEAVVAAIAEGVPVKKQENVHAARQAYDHAQTL